MAKVGRAAVVAGTAIATGLAAGLASSAKAAVDFERQMRNVNSIANLGEKDFKALGKSVTGMAAEVGQKPKVLAAGLYDIVSSGFKASDAIKVLKVSAKAATAGMTDTATASKAVTAALNAYHLGAGKARQVSDVLFQTVNKGVLSFEELSQQMGDLVPASAPLGVSLEEVGASMATLTLQGVPAAEAATRVKSAMIQLAKPSKGLSALLKENGFASGEAAIKAKGFSGVLQLLSDATHGSVSETAKLTPEIRSLLGVVGLTGKNLETYEANLRAMKEAQEGAGITAKVFAEQSKSFAVQWQKAAAALDVFKIQVGNALLPALSAGLTAVSKFFAELNKAEGASAKFGVAMDALKAVIGRAADAFKAINWGAVWEALLTEIGQVSPRIETALRGIGIAAKTTADGISTSWGQFVTAAVIGAASFAAAAQKVVAAWAAMQIGIATINPVMAALVVLAGLVAGALYMIVTRSNEVSAALKTAEQALKSLKSTADAAKDADLTLAESKNRLRQATLDVTTAIKNKQSAVAKEGESSAAAKQAELSVETAYLARQRAARAVTTATEQVEKATHTATATSNTAKNAVKALQAEYAGLIAKGPPLQNAIGRIGIDQDKLNAGFQRQTAKKYAADLNELAEKADKSAASFAKTDPALAKLAAGVAKGARAQAELALSLGKIPPAIDKVAAVASSKGATIGSRLGAGVASGVASQSAAVAAQAAGLVNTAYAAANAAAQSHSDSRLFMQVGMFMGGGVATGIGKSATKVTAAIKGAITGSLAGAIQASTAVIKKLQGELDAMAERQSALDRSRAVRDAGEALAEAQRSSAAAIAEAKKKGEGVAEATRQGHQSIRAAEESLAAARQAIVTASLERRLATEQENATKITDAMSALVTARSAKVEAAFAKVGEMAGRAFEAQTQAYINSVSAKFDSMIAKVRASADALTPAEAALAALDRAEAERQRSQALISAQASGDAEAIRQAQLAIQRAQLEEQARIERAGQEAQAAEQIKALEAAKARELQNLTERRNQQRIALDEHLADLKEKLLEHPKAFTKTQNEILALLKAYRINYRKSGANLGIEFAHGLDEAQDEVRRAAKELAKIPENYLKARSPTKEGPMSTLDTWFKKVGSTLASGLDTGAITKALGSMAVPTLAPTLAPGLAPAAAGVGGAFAGGGGGTTIQLTLDRRVISEVFRQDLIQIGRRNGSALGGLA